MVTLHRWFLLGAALLLVGVPTVSRADEAAASKPADAPAAVEKAAPKPAETSGEKPVAKVEAGKPATEPAFIDRDGDGIQDGQEHRFRRNRDGRGRGHEGGGRQYRYRGGTEAGDGSHGKGKGGQP